MFEQLDETSWLSPSIKSFLAQQVLAVWGPLLCCFVLAIIIDGHGFSDENSSDAVFGYVFIGACAFGLACVVQRFFPDDVRPGRWVWVLPACWFVLGFASELPLMRTAHPLLDNLRRYFHPTRKDLPLALVMFTCPMWACCCYASVMMVSAKRTRIHV